jgi:phage head maturation protease
MKRGAAEDKLFYRSFELDRAQVDQEKRSVDVAFSSETPVRRWFGDEILLHGRNNVDLARLKSMGAALMNHNPGVIVGPIRDVRIEEKRGKALVIFDDDEDGERAMKKVVSGSLRGISVGYMIEKAREVREDEEYEGIKGPALVALRWTPYEISFTPIPADATVGVGREASLDGIHIERSQTTAEEEHTMDKEEILKLIRDALKAERENIVKDTVSAVRAALDEDQKPQIRVSGEDLQALLGRAAAISPEAKVRVAEMVAEGRQSPEITNELLRLATEGGGDAGDTGGGPGGEGTGMNGRQQPEEPASFQKIEDVPDDVFTRMVNQPSVYSFH